MPKKRSYFVYAKLWEYIEPLDRALRYEDPLEAALTAEGLGEITGGGSLVSKQGEIEYAGIDLDLASLERGLQIAAKVLTSCGAPRGSVLEYRRFGKQREHPFGSTEAVAIYLDGINLPDVVYSHTDTDELADLLEKAMSPTGAGEIRASWQGPTETALYSYGRNAEELFGAIRHVLHTYPLCQNARVVLRHGSPLLNPVTLRMPFHTETAPA